MLSEKSHAQLRQWASECRALAAKMVDPAESRVWTEMAEELERAAEKGENGGGTNQSAPHEIRVLRLEPMAGPPADIPRAEPLTHDTF